MSKKIVAVFNESCVNDSGIGVYHAVTVFRAELHKNEFVNWENRVYKKGHNRIRLGRLLQRLLAWKYGAVGDGYRQVAAADESVFCYSEQ